MSVIEKIFNLKNKKTIFSLQEHSLLDKNNIPGHIAIIMDGNRRWAKKRNLPCMMGHWEGAETLTNIVKAALELNIKVITVFAFSTENWTRSKKEIDILMNLFEIYLIRQRRFLQKEKVRLETIGDISVCSDKLKKALAETKEATKTGNRLDLVLAINYGGRDEIKRAFLNIINDYDKKLINREDISEKLISNYLDTSKYNDPDILIRTSGEKRLSNFLLWQSAYSEVITTDVLWPDFSERDLLQAILEYQKRERRLGGA